MPWQTLLPVITLALGAILQYLGQWGADARQRRAAQEARDADRDRARQERRETFELDHLLRLNEALLRYGRAAGRVHFHDAMVAKQSGEYASHQLPEELNGELYNAGREVLSLMHLVLDDNLRATVETVHRSYGRMTNLMRTTVEEADAAMVAAADAQDAAMRGIGARVRQIYLDQAQVAEDRRTVDRQGG
ncbi:hypothetical protein QQG74_28215 [Micromonospora sp. FIMYZ51]|uniref:hypothetical protein n=1 Tax=Micromonospora sp. FIMYZ51 TaxID=3051832 RepID=UPI00311F0FAD